MLSYVAVGLACGVLADQAGMNGLECFLLSATYLSGSGQFMISNLWLQGMPIASLAISVCAVSSRFALYSASLAPALARFSKRESLAIASTYTEEAYGITLGKLAEGNSPCLHARYHPASDLVSICHCQCCHRKRRPYTYGGRIVCNDKPLHLSAVGTSWRTGPLSSWL